MIAVLDTSAAVRVVLQPSPEAPWAEQLAEADLVIAPELIVAELTNTFWKYFRAGQLSRAASEHGLRSSLELVDELVGLRTLSAEAFDLALLLQRPAYDMFYVVLARRNGAVLMTADDSLRQTALRLGIRAAESAR